MRDPQARRKANAQPMKAIALVGLISLVLCGLRDLQAGGHDRPQTDRSKAALRATRTAPREGQSPNARLDPFAPRRRAYRPSVAAATRPPIRPAPRAG